VPAKPSGVLVNGSTPNTLRLHVVPPREYDGLTVLGYRVAYDNDVYEFDAGRRIIGNDRYGSGARFSRLLKISLRTS